MGYRGGRRWLNAASVMTVLAVMSSAQAQSEGPADAPMESVETVVVTGSSIRGVAPAGNTVDSISTVDLEKSGKVTLGDYMRDLPANFAGGVGSADNTQGGQDSSVSSANMTGGQGVNLRALGSLSTLVLVNGRRVASAGMYGDFVDISTIPAIAIDRIEVLKDGASAVYGSDAVGGVVNIILKKGDSGFNTNFQLGTTTQGGGTSETFGQSYGTSWSGGEMFISYEYFHQDAVSAEDRDIYNGGDFSDRGGVNWRAYNGHASGKANIFSGTPSSSGTVAYTTPGGSGTGLTMDDLTAADDGIGNTYDLWENIDILPKSERHSLYIAADQTLGKYGQLRGNLRFTHRNGHYNNGYATLYDTLPSTSPYYIEDSTNAFGVRIYDQGLERKTRLNSLAGEVGWSVDVAGDWHLDVATSFSVEDQRRYSTMLRNGNIYDSVVEDGEKSAAPTSIDCALMGLSMSNLPSDASASQAYCASLGYTAYNPYSTDGTSQEVLDELIGYEDVRFTSWLSQTSVKMDGTVTDLPAGPLKLAVGLDFRRERINGSVDYNWRSINDEHVAFDATQRDIYSAYGELAIPIVGAKNALSYVKELDASLAVRYEHGAGLGAFDTTNPKLGINYKPIDSLKLRGTVGTSFHTPPMRYLYDGVEPITGGNAAFMRADLYTAPCTTSMVELNGVSGTVGSSGNCSFTAIVVTGGAGDTLKPEKSETWTLGADWTPKFLPGLKVGVDYYNILIKDRIVRIQSGSLSTILSNYFATGSSPYSSLIDLNPSEEDVQAILDGGKYLGQYGAGGDQDASDVAAIIYATQANLSRLSTNGLDFSASYAFSTEKYGDFNIFAKGTWITKYAIKAASGSAYEDELGKYSSTGNPVDFRSKQGIDWHYGPLSARFTANFTNGYECASGCYVPDSDGAPTLSSDPVKISSWTTFDLQLTYDLSEAFSWGRDTFLTFSSNNITDEDPPFIDGGTATSDALPDAYDAANATVIGRTVSLTITKRW